MGAARQVVFARDNGWNLEPSSAVSFFKAGTKNNTPPL